MNGELPPVEWLAKEGEEEHAAEERCEHSPARPSQATQLVKLASAAELFHSPDGVAFATLPVGDHGETWPVRSRGFRYWLARRFYESESRAPNSQALQDALGVLEGEALFAGTERPVHVRIAEAEGSIYLDLGDPSWSAIEVDRDGWRIVGEAPVRFRRPRGMSSLPMPTVGGSLRDLRRFLNVSDEGWVLLQGALVNALRPRGPYPVIDLYGEQGSSKSTTARMLKALVDPSTAPLRAEPRDGRDLMIAATNGWLVAFDNVSHLPAWLSNALCRLATGGGFATRELYSDADEVIFDAQRPVILNGIGELATQSDLLDRTLVVNLPSIGETERRTERDLWRQFEAARPLILGALLESVSVALRNLPHVQLSALPRMADFAEWVSASEPALDCHQGAFMAAYSANRKAANELPLEASPIATPLLELADTRFEGTATELLAALSGSVDESVTRRKGWPANGQVLSTELRRLAPNLRAAGIDVEFKPGRRRRMIRLEKAAGDASRPSRAPHLPERRDAGDTCDADFRTQSDDLRLEDAW